MRALYIGRFANALSSPCSVCACARARRQSLLLLLDLPDLDMTAETSDMLLAGTPARRHA
eukprot:scaffold6285_cov121-Isochrysis_galbana.AAC.22